MRSILLSKFLIIVATYISCAQTKCGSADYYYYQTVANPSFLTKSAQIDSFIKQRLYKDEPSMSPSGRTGSGLQLIKIPVIVHVLYNLPEQKISEEQVLSQIAVLNEDFRKLNNISNIPEHFRSQAADCFIEFTLATIDPQGRPTRGIIWKKTSATYFGSDDQIKFSSSGGDDAWDAGRYLNIWIGKLSPGMVGYSSSPGSPKEKDGIVLRYTAVGTSGAATGPYHLGRTAVHEAGHWLGLKHIWGDRFCGDDGVSDTPPQKGPTKGCPQNIIASCDNSSSGSMYMNYMDLTNDACTGMFTIGQRDRMRALFSPGGPRYLLQFSNGAAGPLLPAPADLPDDLVQAQAISIFPNPANNFVVVHFDNIDRWSLSLITLYNHLGQLVSSTRINSNRTVINISQLQNGVYYVKIGTKDRVYKIVKSGF